VPSAQRPAPSTQRLEHIPTDKILALFAKGLNLGYI
jgi:hypothetical protein